MFLIDLKDAYFQIPIHLDSRLYLRFCLGSCVYQFLALCFGLSTAMQVFAGVFAMISEWAHRRGVRLLRYLDDWLVVAVSLPLLLRHPDLVLQLCRGLSIINWEKSDFHPSTRVQYLGMLTDTFLEKVFPSKARLSQFLEVVTSFLALPPLLARMWQQLLGHMASLECFLPWSHSRMCPLQWCLKDFWSPVVDNPALLVPLWLECVDPIRWWLQEDRWIPGVPLQVPLPSLLLHTDASLSGWGAHLLDLTTAWVWSCKERALHINILEMKAVVLALVAFLPQLSHQE